MAYVGTWVILLLLLLALATIIVLLRKEKGGWALVLGVALIIAIPMVFSNTV